MLIHFHLAIAENHRYIGTILQVFDIWKISGFISSEKNIWIEPFQLYLPLIVSFHIPNGTYISIRDFRRLYAVFRRETGKSGVFTSTDRVNLKALNHFTVGDNV